MPNFWGKKSLSKKSGSVTRNFIRFLLPCQNSDKSNDPVIAYSEKGQKKGKKKAKKGKIFENLGKNVQNLKIFWKRAGDCMQLLHTISFNYAIIHSWDTVNFKSPVTRLATPIFDPAHSKTVQSTFNLCEFASLS